MTDGLETRGSPKTEGLARTISVVGLSISQAADELQHAAERLIAAEAQAREADAVARASEEHLAQGATKNAELLQMLQEAGEGQAAADERSHRAEQRLQIAAERARLFEEQAQELKARLEEAEHRPSVTLILDDERTALQEAVAAEVRRPLTSILGITLALKHTDPRTSDGGDMVGQLATHARKLDRLVGEMLDIDRIANGTFVPNLRRTDIEALVRRVADESPDLANRDVRLETDHVATKVDPALVEQMTETLLANAGRRTVPGNTVWIKVSSDPEGVVIAVEDTGPDVPPGLRQALFAALQDAGPGAPTSQGPRRAATGLALLSRLADVHGGRCWVEERPGGGASFRLFLPDVGSTRDPGAGIDDEEGVVTRLEPDTDGEEEFEDAAAIAALREYGMGEGSISI
jgi:K+-sensing histidine kinase KdpD